MKVTIDNRVLQSAINVVKQGASGRSTQAIQNDILLEAEGDSLTLTATDLEYLSVRKTIQADVGEAGACTLDANTAADVFSTLPDGDVNIEASEKTVSVSIGPVRFRLCSLCAADFQKLPTGDGQVVEVDAALLSALFRKTLFNCSRDETRPALTGLLMIVTNDAIVGVSTDNYRLSLLEIALLPNSLSSDFRQEIIVSRNALKVLQATMPDTGRIAMAFSDKIVMFSFDDVEIASRLIEGKFGAYEKVLPEGYTNAITCDTEELAQAVRRVVVIAKDDANRVVFTVANGEVQLRSDASDHGTANDSIKCLTSGELDGFETAYNGAYLLQVLETTDGDDVTLAVESRLKPALLTDGSALYKHVIMPMEVIVR